MESFSGDSAPKASMTYTWIDPGERYRVALEQGVTDKASSLSTSRGVSAWKRFVVRSIASALNR